MAVPGVRIGEVRIEVITNLNNTNNSTIPNTNTSSTTNNSGGPSRQVYTIPAHNDPIHLLTLDLQGKRLATCSDRGTLIRIFDTLTGKKIKELRRGAQQARSSPLLFLLILSFMFLSHTHTLSLCLCVCLLLLIFVTF
jgi:WD40 repeat protein